MTSQTRSERPLRSHRPTNRNVGGRAVDRPLTDYLFAIAIGLVVIRPLADQWRSVNVGTLPLSVTDAIGLAIPLVLYLPLAAGEITAPRSPVSRLACGFAVYAIAVGAVAYIVNNDGEFGAMTARVGSVVGAFLVFYHGERRWPGKMVLAVALAGLGPVCVATGQLIRGVPAGSGQYTPEAAVARVAGSLAHPNALAVMGAFMLLLAAVHLLISPGKNVVRWIGLSGMAGATVVGAYARSVWLALPIAGLIVASALRRPLRLVLPGALAAALAIHIAGGAISTRLSGFTSWQFRETLWRSLLSISEPMTVLFGHGLGKVGLLVRDAAAQSGTVEVEQVHNDYLRVFVETGAVGVALYFAAIAVLALTCWRFVRAGGPVEDLALPAATLGATIVVLVVSATDNLFQLVALQAVYWGMAGAALAVVERGKRHR